MGLTKEQMAKGGRRSAEVRAAKARARATDPLFAIKDDLGKHFEELRRAAYGEGKWKDLPLTAQLSALREVLAYGLGKAVTLDKNIRPDVASEGDGSEAPGTIAFE